MSQIAGTVIFSQNDMSYFLVTDDQHEFYSVKMHRHQDDTALGSILAGMKNELGLDIDNLRLGELAAWRQHSDSEEDRLISLYTFEVVDFAKVDVERLGNLGLHFVSATEAAPLIKNVDMMSVAQLD
jgi:hypothetical protein